MIVINFLSTGNNFILASIDKSQLEVPNIWVRETAVILKPKQRGFQSISENNKDRGQLQRECFATSLGNIWELNLSTRLGVGHLMKQDEATPSEAECWGDSKQAGGTMCTTSAHCLH